MKALLSLLILSIALFSCSTVKTKSRTSKVENPEIQKAYYVKA